MSVSLSHIQEALTRIRPHIHCTPILTSSYVNRQVNNKFQVYFKCEHLQKTGSFKARGALNSILCALERSKNEGKPLLGVVTHSSGNHGQAVAWAADLLGVKCVVVVPKSTPKIKCDAICGYGAELVFCGNSPLDRVQSCDNVVNERHFQSIPPYNHEDTIAGQGTMAVEMLEQVPQLDAIVVAVSGGGLSAGVALAAKALKPSIRVYLVEPAGKGLEPCLASGERLWPNPPQNVDTIAEGIRLQQVGTITLPILSQLCEKKVLTMTNEDMIEGMRWMGNRLKQVVEAAAGAAVQAPLKYASVFPEDVKHVGVIVCGGNVDLDHLPWYSNLS